MNRANNRLYDDISKNEFDKIYNAFTKVYPQISDDLEKGWKSFCQLLTQKKNIKQKFATMSGRNAICISLENTMSVPNVIVLLLNIKKSSNNDLILARSLFEANTKLVVTS